LGAAGRCRIFAGGALPRQPWRKRPIVVPSPTPSPARSTPPGGRLLAAAALLTLLARPAAADDGATPDGTGAAAHQDSDGEPPPDPWYIRSADYAHRALSNGIEGTAKGIDSFFATQEALEEATRSYVKLRLDGSWIARQGDDYRFNTDARLHLPGTERRLHLLVESNPEQDTGNGDPLVESPGGGDTTANEEGLALAIEAWLEGKDRTANWQLRPAAGVRGGLPVNPFARFRVIRRDQFARWDSRFSSTLAYFYQDGLIFNAAKDFDRPLRDDLLFRTRTAYRWSRDKTLQTVNQTFSLFQTLSERRRVAYETGFNSHDDPAWGVSDYFVRIRYRQRIHKHWLFAELQPRLRWPQADHYRQELGLLLRLEAVFGERSLRRSRKED